MILLDEDALVCDFAEFYHVYDYRTLPVSYAATLAVGLRENSRIKMKLTKSDFSPEIALLGRIFDVCNLLLWSETKDAQKNRNRPKSIFDRLDEEKNKTRSYATAEEFETQRNKLLRRG